MHLATTSLSTTILLSLTLLLTLFTPHPTTALQLGSRQTPAHALIGEAQLRKRGNCCSQPDDEPDPAPDYGPAYPSDPSVDDLKTDITTLGTVTGKRSIFYTGLGGINGQNQVEAWACRALDPSGANFVIFRTLIPQAYLNVKLTNLIASPPSIDLWGKRASWAWAELAEGDTYLAIPEGKDPDPQSTWTLYEYPALQRNSGIEHVIRVDPNTGASSTIWTQGSDPTDTPDPGPQRRSGPPI